MGNVLGVHDPGEPLTVAIHDGRAQPGDPIGLKGTPDPGVELWIVFKATEALFDNIEW